MAKTQMKFSKKFYMGIVFTVVAVVAMVAGTLAWLVEARRMVTVATIVSPYKLYIGANNQQPIEQLYMGGIDVREQNIDGTFSKDYVFCVYGAPAIDYRIQLAHTTNIRFEYEIYCADEPKHTQTALNDAVYAEGADIWYFPRAKVGGMDKLILSNLNAINMNSTDHRTATDHRSYDDSDRMQINANAVYLLSEKITPTATEEMYNEFVHYYILRLKWDGNVENTKETDIIYLTVEGE